MRPGRHTDFERLANEHKDAIYRQMLRACGNREDAEDVLVEALLKAYCSMDQLRDSQAFRAWLAQIARRVCWQVKAAEALLPLRQLSELEGGSEEPRAATAAPDDAAANAELRRMLADAMATLPVELREVYQLRDIEEVSGEEAAARLDLSVAAMKSRLHRARAALRAYMEAVLATHRNQEKKGRQHNERSSTTPRRSTV